MRNIATPLRSSLATSRTVDSPKTLLSGDGKLLLMELKNVLPIFDNISFVLIAQGL